MEKSNFDLLMQRYLDGTASDQERTKLEAWLDVMKTKNTTDLELSKEDEEKLFQKITSRAIPIDEVVSFQPKQENKRGIRWALQFAAALLILVSVSYLLWNTLNQDAHVLLVTSRDGVEKIILTDGTIVWLQQGSTLTYFEKKQAGTRHTEFQGEALFEVAKDASHPFIITCGGVRLQVLGTSFSIKAGKDSLQLVVLTGKVNLSSGKNVNVDAAANEKIVFANHEVKRLQLQPSEAVTLVANTEYNMQFENATIDEVARKVGKKFNVEVTTEKQVGQCRITADFTDQSLESTLQLIKEVLDVSYSQHGNVLSITGPGCN